MAGLKRFARAGAMVAVAASLIASRPAPSRAGNVGDRLTAVEGRYTIGWMSDTQNYSARYAETFSAMTEFLYENRERMNLIYVAHTGDIVSTEKKTAQWENAAAAMDGLGDVPHGVLAGNHDKKSSKNYENYQKYFGAGRFEGLPWYGGQLNDNVAHYDLVDLGSRGFIFVYLSDAPTAESIDWANRAFAEYPDRVGVLCTHKYLTDGPRVSTSGRKLQREIVEANPNVYMVLCGHRRTQDFLLDEFDDDGDGEADRSVYQFIANYQNLERGGSGYIRFLQVDEIAGVIRFYTYSPELDQYRDPPKSSAHWDEALPIPWEIYQ